MHRIEKTQENKKSIKIEKEANYLHISFYNTCE